MPYSLIRRILIFIAFAIFIIFGLPLLLAKVGIYPHYFTHRAYMVFAVAVLALAFSTLFIEDDHEWK